MGIRSTSTVRLFGTLFSTAPKTPKGWQILDHATNTSRWDVEAESIEIGNQGLFLDFGTRKELAERLKKDIGYEFKRPSDSGQPMRVRVLLPLYETESSDTELVAKTYLRNFRQGENIIIPRGTNLIRIKDEEREGKQVIYYVPETLLSEYRILTGTEK